MGKALTTIYDQEIQWIDNFEDINEADGTFQT